MVSFLDLDINLWAVLLATVVGMVVGALWYGPILGKQWMEMVGLKEGEMGGDDAPMLYGIAALASLGTAFMLNVIVSLANITDMLTGIGIAALLWIFFIFLVELHHSVFAGRSWKLVLVDSGKDLVMILLQIVIIIYMMPA